MNGVFTLGSIKNTLKPLNSDSWNRLRIKNSYLFALDAD